MYSHWTNNDSVITPTLPNISFSFKVYLCSLCSNMRKDSFTWPGNEATRTLRDNVWGRPGHIAIHCKSRHVHYTVQVEVEDNTVYCRESIVAKWISSYLNVLSSEPLMRWLPCNWRQRTHWLCPWRVRTNSPVKVSHT